MNAIELVWTIPVAIPSATTTAVVSCSVNKDLETANVNHRFFKIL
jgi:methylglyoxal synthase